MQIGGIDRNEIWNKWVRFIDTSIRNGVTNFKLHHGYNEFIELTIKLGRRHHIDGIDNFIINADLNLNALNRMDRLLDKLCK